MGGQVLIGDLSTNLWDEFEVRHVSWRTAEGTMAGVEIDSLRVRWSSGPPWSGPPAALAVSGLHLQVNPGDGGEQVIPATPDLPIQSREPLRLPAWIADTVRVEGVEVSTQGEVVGGFWGPLTMLRVSQTDAADGLTRVKFDTDAATVRFPSEPSTWPVDLLGSAVIGADWIELEASLRTQVHHVMVDAYAETGEAVGSRRPLFDIQAWLGLKDQGLASVANLDSSMRVRSLAIHLNAHGYGATSLVAHVQGELEHLVTSGVDLGDARLVADVTGDGLLMLDTLTLTGTAGNLFARGQINWPRPHAVDVAVELNALQLETWSRLVPGQQLPLVGEVDVQFTWQGDLDDPTQIIAHLQGEGVHFGDLDLQQPVLQLDYTRPSLHARFDTPYGSLAVDGDVAAADTHELLWRVDDVNLAPLQQLGGIRTVAGVGRVEAHTSGSIHRPRIQAELELREIRLGALRLPSISSAAEVDTGGNVEVTTRAGGLQILARGDWQTQQLLAATVQLKDDPLSKWLAHPWAQDWSGELQVDLSASGSLQEPKIEGQIQIDELGLRGRNFGDVSWSMSLAKGTAQVRVTGLDSSARLQGSLHLDEGLPFDLQGQLHDTQLRPFLEMLTDHPSAFGGHIRAGLQVSGQISDLEATRVRLTLDDLMVSSPSGALSLTTPSTARWVDETLHLDSLRLAGSAGEMDVTGVASRRGPIHLKYRLTRLALPYVASFLDIRAETHGDLSGYLDVSGVLAAPIIGGGIGVEGLRLGTSEVGDLQARFSSADGMAHLEELELRLPRGGTVTGTASFPVAVGEQTTARSVHAEVHVDSVSLDTAQGLPPEVVVTMAGRVSAHGKDWDGASLDVILHADQLSVATADHTARSADPVMVHWQRGDLRASTAHFVVAENASSAEQPDRMDTVAVHGNSADSEGFSVAAERIDLEMLSQILGVERSVHGIGSAQALWRGTWPAARIDVRVEMQNGSVDSVHVDELLVAGRYDTSGLSLDTLHADAAGGTLRGSGFVNRDSLRLAVNLQDFSLAPLRHSWQQSTANAGPWSTATVRGDLHGSVQIEGPRSAPRWQMQAAIIDGALEIPSFEPALQFSSAQVFLTPDTLIVTGLEDPDGRWSLTASAQIANGTPTSFQTAMQLHELRIVVPETMKLTVDGSLAWQGTPEHSTVTGKVLVAPGHLVERMSLRTLAFADSAAALTTTASSDTATTALRNVHLDVDLAGRDLLLDNDLARIPFDTQLLVGGTAAQPTIRGGLHANEGSIFYMGQEFEVSQTRFEFADERPLEDVYVLFHNPVRLDPAVDFAAQTELKAKNGNEYDIHLGLGGTLADLQVTLTSEPAESQVDILSLLNFGKTGVPMVDARGGMLSTGVNLSPKYLLSVTESQFGRVLGLDNVEIDNSILKPGRLAGSRIVLTKQLGKRTEMIYSTTVGYASQGRVQLQYDLGRHIYLQTQHDARGESGIDLNLKLTFK
jgi:hypothetical protein